MRIEYNTESGTGAEELISKVLAAAESVLKTGEGCEVLVSFLEADEIRGINAQHRGKDEATDVLSFPYIEYKGGEVLPKDYKNDINPDTGRVMLGEILICLERANEQAEEYGHSVSREISYLALHGLLHICGYDHESDTDKKAMREKEEEILLLAGESRER